MIGQLALALAVTGALAGADNGPQPPIEPPVLDGGPVSLTNSVEGERPGLPPIWDPAAIDAILAQGGARLTAAQIREATAQAEAAMTEIRARFSVGVATIAELSAAEARLGELRGLGGTPEAYRTAAESARRELMGVREEVRVGLRTQDELAIAEARLSRLERAAGIAGSNPARPQ